jgi:hypothetical protein
MSTQWVHLPLPTFVDLRWSVHPDDLAPTVYYNYGLENALYATNHTVALCSTLQARAVSVRIHIACASLHMSVRWSKAPFCMHIVYRSPGYCSNIILHTRPFILIIIIITRTGPFGAIPIPELVELHLLNGWLRVFYASVGTFHTCRYQATNTQFVSMETKQ